MPKPLQLRPHITAALKSGQERNEYCHLTVKAALAFLIYSKHFFWQTTGFFASELRLKTKSQQEHNSNLDWSRKMYWWIACPLNCKSRQPEYFLTLLLLKNYIVYYADSGMIIYWRDAEDVLLAMLCTLHSEDLHISQESWLVWWVFIQL